MDLLVGDIDRCLQRVELPALDGVTCSSRVSAVTDEARFTAIAGALTQGFLGPGMQRLIPIGCGMAARVAGATACRSFF